MEDPEKSDHEGSPGVIEKPASLAHASTFTEDHGNFMSEVRPELPLSKHILFTLAYDAKQLTLSFALGLLCTVFVTLGMFLVGSSEHLSNVVVFQSIADFSGWSDGLDMSITCRAIFIYRLYYFWWELDCRKSSSAARFDIKEICKSVVSLLLELAVAVALLRSTSGNFNPHMGYALLVLLVSLFAGVALKNLFFSYELFVSDKVTQGVIKPLFGSIVCAFPLISMYMYALAMHQYEDLPYIQSVIVGVLYPGIVVLYKQFMLGKYGGQYIFGGGMHLNEEWNLDQAKMNAYTSIVRSIHGMYFPQSVGLFVLFFESRSGFILTCLLRVMTQAMIKVATFYVDEQQAILYAKRDGVYDRDVIKIGKASVERRKGALDLSSSFTSKKKLVPILNSGVTPSQEAAQARSKFGLEAVEKQLSPGSSGTNLRKSGMSADVNTFTAHQTPFMSCADIDRVRLSSDDNASLAKFVGATKDVESVFGWKAVGKTTHGTSTWLKEIEAPKDEAAGSPKSPKASKSNPRMPTNAAAIFRGKKDGKKVQFKAWREIKDFSPSQIFSFLTMREDGNGEITSTFSASARDFGTGQRSSLRDSYARPSGGKEEKDPYRKLSKKILQRGGTRGSIRVSDAGDSPPPVKTSISPSLSPSHSPSSWNPSPRENKRKMSTNLSLKVLHKVLINDDKRPPTTWNNVVHEFAGHEIIIQNIVNFPTPHRNREFIVKQIGLKFPDGTRVILRKTVKNGDHFCAPNKRNIMADLDIGGYLLTPSENGRSTFIAVYNLVNLKGSITEIATKSVAPLFAGDLIDLCVHHFDRERLWPTSSSPLTAEERLLVQGQRMKLKMTKSEIAAQGINLMGKKEEKDEWKLQKFERPGIKSAHRYNSGGGSEKSVKVSPGNSAKGSLELYSEFVVAGSAVSVASEIAFGKTVDPPKFVEAVSGHTSIWRATFKVPKPFKCRDNVFRQIRTVEDHSSSFIITTNDTTHEDYPIVENIVRANCNGIFTVTPITSNKCRVKRYAYADIKASLPVHVVETFIKHSNEHFVDDLIEVFSSRREKARVEGILKAREDMLEVAWRDTLDPYTPQETQMVQRAQEWVNDCEVAASKWIDVENNHFAEGDVIMKRRSVDIRKSHRDDEEENQGGSQSTRPPRKTDDEESHSKKSRKSLFGGLRLNSVRSGSTSGKESVNQSNVGKSLRNLFSNGQSTRKVTAVIPNHEGGPTKPSSSTGQRGAKGVEELDDVMRSLSSKQGYLFPSISRLGSGSTRSGTRSLKSAAGKGRGLLHNVASQVRHALGVKSHSERKNAMDQEAAAKRRTSQRRSSKAKSAKERNSRLILNPEISFKRELDENGNYGAVPVGEDHGIDLDGKKEKRRGSALGRSIQQAKRESQRALLASEEDESRVGSPVESSRDDTREFRGPFEIEDQQTMAPLPEIIKRLKTQEIELEKEDDLDAKFDETFKNSTRGARTKFMQAMKDALGGTLSARARTEKTETRIKRQVSLKKKERSLVSALSGHSDNGELNSGRNHRGTGGSESGVQGAHDNSASSNTLHYGLAKAVIDMPSPMIKAWISDAHNMRGYREADEGSEERVARYQLEKFNDHSYVDYRRTRGYWPILDREAILYHISMDLPDGSVHRVKTLEDGRSELTYCFSFADAGNIPSWVLQKRVGSALGVVGRCKQQLDKKMLRAKMTTWKERMAKLRKRMGLKWNVESLVEKTLMVVSLPVCMYLFGEAEELTQKAMAFAMAMLLITETISDVITLIVSKRLLAIDIGGKQTWTDAGFEDFKSTRNMILSISLPAVCCLLVFLILDFEIEVEKG
ncbi:hypothetical protein TrVE_jg8763 [Triparma verrucosa]|uniref:START domain-containing protein n=1 Tax=Triparma verrucosa TaxID=1606542 RepID=A0A9W7DNM2_9STRA|nr:hypothetical protein TrVE_jg8763 [Triparma verrucosa]